MAAAPAPDAVFRIASLTKLVTTVAALRLVDAGRLRLDDPVGDLVPPFDALQVLDGWKASAPCLRPPSRRATVRHLLTHTAGLDYWFSSRSLARYHRFFGIPDPTHCRASLFELPLLSDPGVKWEYGTSTDWLGRVVEAVTGDRLGDFFDRDIFGPLGMTDTTFRPVAAQRDRMQPLHLRTRQGLKPLRDGPVKPEFDSGAGGLVSTVPDFLNLLEALLGGGRAPLLAPDTLEAALSDQLGGPEMTKLQSHDPIANDFPEPQVPESFGFGFRVSLADGPNGRRMGSGSWDGLFNCTFWIDRRADVAGVFMTQLLPWADRGARQALAAVERWAYASSSLPATG